MPPKRKVANNKKKKTKEKGGVANNKSKGKTNGSVNPGIDDFDFSTLDQLVKDDAAAAAATNTDAPSPATEGGGLYGLYKQATQRFKDGLAALVPAEIFAQDRVQTIMDAVDYIVEHEIVIEPGLVEVCRVSLQFRKKYSKQIVGGGDEGHEYFISVLNYCCQCLKPLVPKPSRKAAHQETARTFSFTDLELSDSEDDEEEDTDTNTIRKPQRPKEPTHEFSLHDLMYASDRVQAAVFLDSVDSAMRNVSDAYKNLKRKMRAINDPNRSACVLEDVMHCAVITNLSMRQIEMMEKELEFDHPHLTTFYRIIVCRFMIRHIDELGKRLRANGKNVSKTELTIFLGDVLEYQFHDAKTPNNIEQLVAEFCRKWSMPRDDDVDDLVMHVLEDTDMNEKTQLQSTMKCYKYIGGKRCILQTQANVQYLSSQKEMTDKSQRGKLHLYAGAFGTMWDEKKNLAEKFLDFDQLLMQDILAELVPNCCYGLLSYLMETTDAVFPLFTALYRFTENTNRAVPLSLTFGVHAMLTAIFELQGNNDVGTIAKLSKSAYNLFFDQLEKVLFSYLPYGKGIRDNLKSLMIRKFLPLATNNAPVNESSEEHAFWNPYCAGMFLTYLSFQTNLRAGAFMIDNSNQLRIVLHLYNALQQRNLINVDIPLLKSLDQYFDGVKFVWGAEKCEKPKRDNIVKRFWLMYNVRAELIPRLHEECRRFVLTPPKLFIPRLIDMNTRDGHTVRFTTPHNAEAFSESYKRINLGDFSAVDDRKERLQTDEQSSLEPWIPHFVSRVNDTLDSMWNEREMLSWNMTAVGDCLNAFLYHLFDELGWKKRIEGDLTSMLGERRHDTRAYRDTDAYQERFLIIREIVYGLLGPMEFVDTLEHRPAVLKARDCLVEYFTTLDKSKYSYLVMSDKDEAEKAALAAKETSSE